MLLNKKSLLTSSILIGVYFSTNAFASSCPFDGNTPRPDWVTNLTQSNDNIVASGVVEYKPSLHKSIFDLRKASENQAMLAIASQIEAKVINELLVNKSLQEKNLITQVSKISSQTTEYTLPEVVVNQRWLDKENCTLWTQVSISDEVVSDNIDEVAELETNVENSLDAVLTTSEIEELNKKQFYMNYAGFSKAVATNSFIEIDGVEKSALTWMLKEGFDPIEPSNGKKGIWINGFSVTFNLSPIAQYLFSENPSKQQIEYILDSFKKANLDVNKLTTAVHPQQFNLYSNYTDSNYFILSNRSQPNALNAPFELSISLDKAQEPNRLKLDKAFIERTSFNVGGWNLLHLATFANRPDLIELMLSHGIDPNFQDAAGMTPAQYAIWTGNKQLIDAYLKHPKSLDGIYSIASKVILNEVISSVDVTGTPATNTHQVMTNLIEIMEEIKSKDKANIHSVKQQLQQNIEHLKNYYSLSDRQSDETKKIQKHNIQMLESFL